MERRSSISACRLRLYSAISLTCSGQFGLVVAEGEAEDFQCPFLPLGRGERLRGFAGQVGGAVQARLDPYLGCLLALGVHESFGLGRLEVVVGAEDAAALELDVGRSGEPPGGFGDGFPLAAGVVGLGELLPDEGGALAERGPGARRPARAARLARALPWRAAAAAS